MCKAFSMLLLLACMGVMIATPVCCQQLEYAYPDRFQRERKIYHARSERWEHITEGAFGLAGSAAFLILSAGVIGIMCIVNIAEGDNR